ncbi:DsbA family oxidoreductase [Jonesiaceae bacterium BS-20]|uniref:DsbA family oxidoreductase n=1 Tax=Jonesiaceae bacterium BS-20 TaxID=3120821 RepID=A0AAU7DTG1_9MICO
MSEKLTVDIWSDIACPWCYIGKRKFEAGLANFSGKDAVTVEYHSFELAPDTPVDFEGSEVDFLAKHKGLPVAQVEQMLDQVTQVAASVGLDYQFDHLKHTKTLKAHEILHFAKAHGKQIELKERLLKAYFTEGQHVGKQDVLVALAAEVGLDAEQAALALADGTYANEVQADIDQARAYGINGVPFFVINNKYGISGTQDPRAFTQALEQAATDLAQEQA